MFPVSEKGIRGGLVSPLDSTNIFDKIYLCQMQKGDAMGYDHHDAMKLSNQLCFPLYAAARNVTSLYTPWLKPLGLTYT